MSTATSRSAAGSEWGWFLLPAAASIVLLCDGALWVGGWLAAHLGGHGGSAPLWSWLLVVDVIRRGPVAALPGVPLVLLWVCVGAVAILMIVALALLAMAAWALLKGSGAPERAMASRKDLQEMSAKEAGKKARALRPSLRSNEAVAAQDCGLRLFRHMPGGQWLHMSWEDVLVAFMAPRSGKSTALAIPAILEAPGAVIATANKSDLVLATRELRQRDTGCPVGLFDPMGIMHEPQAIWFDLLAGVRGVAGANALAEHFMQTARDDSKGGDFWSSAAHDLLASLILAAACTPGRTLHDVYTWLTNTVNPEPVELLRAAGHFPVAGSVAGRQGGAPETRDGIYETARTAAACLQDASIMAWVTPQPDLAVFDPTGFVVSAQTIYLLSKDADGISAAPLVAAVTDQVLQAATAQAERNGGRLDPPLVAVLDEAANICRIQRLPQLYSFAGSQGIQLMTILQSWAQGAAVWGEKGMEALWGASTVKVIGSGIQDDKFAGRLCRLIGQRDVVQHSYSSGNRSRSTSTSTRKEDIMPVSQISALPKWQGLLLVTGRPVAMVAMVPWFRRPRADEIVAAHDAALHALTERANTPVGVS